MLSKSVRAWSVSLLCAVALGAASCSKDSSPTGPSDSPATQTPGGSGNVQVSINPNPVPFSGQPVTDSPGCATLKNTWFYDQVFTEMSGAAVMFSSRVDFFDGFSVNNITGLNIQIPARGTATLKARWCSGNATTHTAQTTFTGVDGAGRPVTLTTPVIRLLAP